MLFDNTPEDIQLPNPEHYSIKPTNVENLFEIDIPNGKLSYCKHFFDQKVSDSFFRYFYCFHAQSYVF